MFRLPSPGVATLAAGLLATVLPAQGTPFPVANLNTAPPQTYDYGTLRAGRLVGAFAIFLASDGQETRVWRTDGTSAGTTLLRRIPAAHPSGDPIEIVGGNDRAFFVGPDLGGGKELWTTDGTAAGTLAIGNGGTAPLSLAYEASAARCWFSATDSSNGRELWRSDGTAATTVRVTQLRAGSLDGMLAQPKQVAPLPSGVYFAGQNSTSGVELWRISGITQSLFANIAAGAASSNPRELTWSGDYLMFAADGPGGTEPYCVALGTLQSLDVVLGTASSSPDNFVAYQPTLTQPLFWFRANTLALGREPVRYNPFSQTTSIVDLAVGGTSSDAAPQFQFGSQVALAAESSPSGFWVWSVPGNGTTPTPLVSTFFGHGIGRISNSPGRFVVRHSFPSGPFTLVGGTDRSDGTVGGTVAIDSFTSELRVVTELPGNSGALLGDGRVVSTTGAPVPLVPTGIDAGSNLGRLAGLGGNAVVFCVDDTPWCSNGTAAGTQPLLTSPVFQTGPYSPMFAGHRFFVGGPTVRLYRTDGTPAGTVALPGTLVSGTTVAWAATPTQLLLFLGDNLYATDGVAAPMLLRTGLPAQPAPAALGNLVLFRGLDATTGVELWRSDGTAAGTVLVRDIRSGVASALGTGNETQWSLRALPGQLLFAADDALGDEVWRTDGTTLGTTIVSNVAPGPAAALVSLGGVTADGRLLFAATAAATGRDLWSTNGTPAGTQLLVDDTAGTTVQVLGPVGTQWQFAIGDASTARLYTTGGTAATTTLLTTLVGGAVQSGTAIAAYGGSLQGITLFRVGSSIYRSDGTGFNTFALGQAPTLSQGTSWFTLPGADVAVFGGTSTGFGVEPWRSNGFASGTARLFDIHPGSASSSPSQFTASGSLVFFTADDGTTGRELWAMPTFPAVVPYGTGCPGTAGLVPRIAAEGAPRLGTTIDFELSSALPSGIAVLSLGLTGLEIPLGGGCSALTDALVLNAVLTSPVGTAQLPLSVPPSSTLVGVSVFAQYAVIDPNGAFAASLALSSGLQAVVGA
jgi:ELWxxDGT repeat protein